ncbi:hypothetical protein BMETH_2094_0 [methanotrophic bacterial endosymbiont of Bathymodiolus sp.]|nr:hypothetical protein BMETH_2094_0 [methanotrophic bacterial endosymbiont of Bathymodiolus sp.]
MSLDRTFRVLSQELLEAKNAQLSAAGSRYFQARHPVLSQ